MNCAALLLCLVSLAQITPDIPDGTTVFTVTYKTKTGGDVAVVNAAIRADDHYIDTYDRANLPARLELVLDEPWNGYPTDKVLIQNIVEAEPEPDFKRKLRYDNSGAERVETDNGAIWIPVETKQRFEQMKALQEARDAERDALLTSIPLDFVEQTAGNQGPGFAARWGRHVMVIVFAAISLVVAVKVFF